MFANLHFLLNSGSQLLHPAIVTEPKVMLLENFSSPQFLVSLLSGLMMAFAFQLLLTNLSVAFIASPGALPDSDHDSDGLISTIRGIETKVGVGALVTVTIALFAACFLAVKLSLVSNSFLGAIIGVVIWSTYFSVMVWLGSSAVGSLIGSIMSTATSGLQGIVGTATTALGANAAKNQLVSTAEDITAAVRRELTSGIDAGSIQKTFQSSLSKLKLPNLDLDEIGSQFEKLLKESDLKGIADSDLLHNIDRQSFVDLISSRADFSKKDINQIADRLESTWKQLVGKEGKKDVPSQLRDLLKSATPEDLNSDELGNKLQQLVKGSDLRDGNGGTLSSQVLQFGLSALLGKVVQNTNFSDLDVAKVSGQLQKLKVAVLGDEAEDSAQPQSDPKTKSFSVIRADLENYLLFSPPWELSQTAVKKEFKDVVYDPQADPAIIRQELEHIDRSYFVDTLSLRDDLKPESIQNLSNYLEDVRGEVLGSVQGDESTAPSPDLKEQAKDSILQVSEQAKAQYEKTTTAIGDYLRKTNLEELDPAGIQQDLTTLLDDPQAGAGALRDRLAHIDRDTLVKLLTQQGDLTEEQVNKTVDQVQSAIKSIIKAPRRLANRVQKQALDFEANLENYLRNTHKEELNPEGIKRDLQLLLKDPGAGFSSFGDRLGQFDRSTFVALLSQRQDLSEEEANRIADQVESTFRSLTEQIQKVQQTFQSAIDSLFGKVRDYLNSLERPELSYEGLQEDFSKVFNDPHAGFEALGDRFSHFDRETLVAVLSSRDDISEADANRIIEKVEETRDRLMHQAQQVQQEVQKRFKAIKQQAQQQAIETQKIAAGAAWWLFGTALTSLAASAIAGMMAVNSLSTL
jgi:hypothetical protein